MLARRRSIRPFTRITTLAAAVAAGIGLGGCSQQGHWSPTADAMAGANRRSECLARADAPHAGTRIVVLSQDHYAHMANPSLSDSSNTTATAGVETGQ